MTMRFVILGAPRTKGNHTQRVSRGGRVFTVQSDASYAWAQYAILQVKTQLHRYRGDTFSAEPLNMAAKIYRDADRGDLDNFEKNIRDVLQAAGAVSNDRWIKTHNGTELLVDRKNPRVEIELTPIATTEAA